MLSAPRAHGANQKLVETRGFGSALAQAYATYAYGPDGETLCKRRRLPTFPARG
jgi:hypothetical protein